MPSHATAAPPPHLCARSGRGREEFLAPFYSRGIRQRLFQLYDDEAWDERGISMSR